MAKITSSVGLVEHVDRWAGIGQAGGDVVLGQGRDFEPIHVAPT